jgi:hypothetical protein
LKEKFHRKTHICHLDSSPFRIVQLQLCNRYYFIRVVLESFRIRVFWYRFFPLNGPNGKANVRNSLIHILNCCIFCCYIMTSKWWTFSLQPNQMRLWWKSDSFVGRWRNWTCCFRGKDLNAIFYQNIPNLHNRYKSVERKISQKNPQYM